MQLKMSWKGCLIGCGSVVLLTGIFVVTMIFWLKAKGEFDVQSSVLAPESHLYLRANLRKEDGVLIEFLTTQTQRMNELNPAIQNFPNFFRDWQKSKTKTDFEHMLPLEIELVDQELGESLGGSIGFSLYNNAAKVAFFFVKRKAKKENNLREYQGTPYVSISSKVDRPFYLSLKDNIFYASESEPGIQSMLSQTEALDQKSDPRLKDVDLEAPFYGFLIDTSIHDALVVLGLSLNRDAGEEDVYEGEEAEQDELSEIPSDKNAELEELSQALEILLQKVQRIGYDLRLKDSETLAGNLILDMEISADHESAIGHAVEIIIKDAKLEVDYEISQREGGYRVAFNITGFKAVMRHLQEEIEHKKDH